ncbi:2-isopropylmalate synthase (Alpha-isopropylmalate synthase) (Alpha-IPM synthetase) [Mycoemilia scoparia]|uniref:2-isopropylmalate synthase n=1 Tax=Mycoemilia scoparia TaxID=417184 RepID=A0A9W7ZVT3_9FUNG|nr:2-isopropylmalate synthase (Alpha-isopropylmalate synthase) (Alpha-IPM synthetase) [Mycoemilia scoparia]
MQHLSRPVFQKLSSFAGSSAAATTTTTTTAKTSRSYSNLASKTSSVFSAINQARNTTFRSNSPTLARTMATVSSNQNSDNKRKLIVFDTTLRDGEQSPGVTLNTEEKIAIARELSKLGVDVIEAGFPQASPGDFQAVRRIAEEVGPMMEGREHIGSPTTICGLARCVEGDIRRAYEAVKAAPKHRIHTFLATSDIHLKHKLKISREDCIERAVKMVTLCKSLVGDVGDVEFSPEDAGRSDPEFLYEILGRVIEAGATTLNIPDTVGYRTPSQYGELIRKLRKNTPGSQDVIWSTHCHNDLGMATSNTLAGIENGATQVEVTVNGIGERAGNTSLEEVVMSVHTHRSVYPVYHTINTKMFVPISRMVSDMTGMVVQPNKPIVGRNAFLHQSGIHQDGVIKNPETYEIMNPADVGVTTSNISLGKLSGRNAVRQRLNELGYTGSSLSDDLLKIAFARFKEVADHKKTPVTDQDLHAIISESRSKMMGKGTVTSGLSAVPNDSDAIPSAAASKLSQVDASSSDVTTAQSSETSTGRYQLLHMQIMAGSKVIPTATIAIRDSESGQIIEEAASAQGGPIEAIFGAIQRVAGVECTLSAYDVAATSQGSDSLGKVSVRISPVSREGEKEVHSFSGLGADTDILSASAYAYISAINRMIKYYGDAEAARSTPGARSVQV